MTTIEHKDPNPVWRMVRHRYSFEIDPNCTGRVCFLAGIDFGLFSSFILRISADGRVPNEFASLYVNGLVVSTEHSASSARIDMQKRHFRRAVTIEQHRRSVVVEETSGHHSIDRHVHFLPGVDRLMLRFTCPPAPGIKYSIRVNIDAFLKEKEATPSPYVAQSTRYKFHVPASRFGAGDYICSDGEGGWVSIEADEHQYEDAHFQIDAKLVDGKWEFLRDECGGDPDAYDLDALEAFINEHGVPGQQSP